MDIHLYLMCYQGEALVASHLSAEEFGSYMAVGTKKLTKGNLVFFEIDPNVQSDYLRTSIIKDRCIPHSDGTPRRSKYISVYRVLEHLPLDVYRKLHLVTRDGRVLSLDAGNYDDRLDAQQDNFYTELAPGTPRVVSPLKPREFCKFITDPNNPVSVPRIFFADSLIERDADGQLAGYLPYANPTHIVDCIHDLSEDAGKLTKTVERHPQLIAFYRTIGRGFFLGDQTGMKFYPFPSRDELEERHHLWWRSASID